MSRLPIPIALALLGSAFVCTPLGAQTTEGAPATPEKNGQEKPDEQGAHAPAFPAPDSAAVSIEQALAGGVGWLVANQNADGSFGSHESPRPDEVLASVPGSQEAFRVATTALCVIALSDAGIGGEPAAKAVARALDYLIKDCAVKRQSGLEHYNVWSFGYALQCFAEVLARNPEDPRAGELRAAAERMVEKLGLYQTLDGGWGYLSLGPVPTMQPSETSMSFTTATILVGVARAQSVGIAIPEQLLKRALEELRRSRLPDGAFLYGDYLQYRPRMDINERSGSACRAPACLYALELCGETISTQDYQQAMTDLLVRYPDYQKSGVRRPIPHESWYHISGYFYLYGHAYAAYTLEKVPVLMRPRLARLIADAVLYCRDPDGSFWDYPLYSYHKPYGTAFALMALARAQKVLAVAR